MVAEKQLNWYVVKTRSRAEQKVAQRISAKGLNVYLPLQKTIRQWSDRKKKVEVPLISSTLFVKTEEKGLGRSEYGDPVVRDTCAQAFVRIRPSALTAAAPTSVLGTFWRFGVLSPRHPLRFGVLAF